MNIKCLTPGCTKARHTRGVCCACYHRLIQQVKTGTTTWQKLEQQGKCRPVDKVGQIRWGSGKMKRMTNG